MPPMASRWRQPDGKEVRGLQEQRRAISCRVAKELSFANNLSNLSRHGPHFPHKVFRQDVALTDTHLGPGKLQEMDTAKPTWLSDIQKL